jgi:hypothetical protein
MNLKDGITSLTQKLTNLRNSQNTNRITSSRVDYEELRAIYRSGMGSKIIRLKSGIALNETLQFETQADKDFYQSRLDAHVKRASKFMLGFGRSLVVIHEQGGDLSQPLPEINDWSKVRYHVFSGDMVFIQSVNYNLNSPNYFKPERYSVRGFTIHPSRVVDFKYVEPVEQDAPEYQFGGISEFELIRNELVADQVVQRAVPAILDKSSTLFYKVKGFKDLLASKREGEMVSYYAAIERARSIFGAVLTDQEDEIETHDQALTNLAESDMITLRRLAMVTGLPLSWLVGEAARGLNSTGEGERQVLMQTIETLQSDYLLERINRLMALHGRGRVWFKDNQGESPKERAAYEQVIVNIALLLWQMGEDHTKYLEDHDIVTDDPFSGLFVKQENEVNFSAIEADPSELSSEPNENDLAVDPKASLNGAQVTAILEIVQRIRSGEISKATAERIIGTAFPVDEAQARALISDVQEGIENG